MKTIRSTGDLGRLLGLSRWTVSRALNGHKDIAPATAEWVRSEAARLGFAPSLIGRTLRSGTTDWIGITIPDPETYFLTGKVRRLQELLAAEGWQALIQVTEDAAAEERALERFAAMRCGGVVLVAARAGAAAFARLRRNGVPAVAVDPLAPAGADEVCTDRAGGMRALIAHLHERGVRRVVAAEMPPDSKGYVGQRNAGMRAAAKRLGWAPDAIRTWAAEGLAEISAGAALAGEGGVWRGAQAIMALNDRVAFGFLQSLPRGTRVPGDLLVTGYDNSEIAAFSRPPLTTVDPRPDELMARTSEMLLGAISRRRRAAEPQKTVVKPLLIFRDSA